VKAAVLNFDNKKSSRLYFKDKKTNKIKRLSDNIFRDLKLIPRANDSSKKLSLKARNLLTNLFQMIQKSSHKEIFVDHKFLSEKTEVESSKQNARLLDQISDIIDSAYHNHINFHGKYLSYGYVIKLTENGYEKATNPEKFYSVSDGQKCLSSSTKMSTQMDKNVHLFISKQDTLQEIEEIAYGYISSIEEEVSIKERNNARAQEKENTTCSNAILTEHSQVAIPEPKETVTACDDTNKPKLLTSVEEKAIHLQRMQRDPNEQSEWSLSALMKKIISKQENVGVLQLEVETIPSISPIEKSVDQPKTEILSNNEEAFMKQEETNLISEKETRKMLLSKAIFDAFGTTANEIQDNCKFEETEVGKVTIKPAIGVSFNDIEKAKIRKCIKSVYGEGVVLALVNTNLYVNKEPVVTESGFARSDVLETSSQNNPQWLQFKSALTKVLLKKHEEKIALHIWKNWFDKLRVRDDTTSQKLILVGSVFTIQWIDDKFGLELENAVLASNLTIELRDEANRNRPLIFSKETIKRG